VSDGCCLRRRPKESGGRRVDIQQEIKGSMLLLAAGGMVLAAPIGMPTAPVPERRPEADIAHLADERAFLGVKLPKVSSAKGLRGG